jgi:hypothetical protein
MLLTFMVWGFLLLYGWRSLPRRRVRKRPPLALARWPFAS